MLIILKLLIVRTISKIYFIDYSNGFTIEILIDVNICLLWYNIVQKKKKTEASSCKDIIGIKQARVSPPIFFLYQKSLCILQTADKITLGIGSINLNNKMEFNISFIS